MSSLNRKIVSSMLENGSCRRQYRRSIKSPTQKGTQITRDKMFPKGPKRMHWEEMPHYTAKGKLPKSLFVFFLPFFACFNWRLINHFITIRLSHLITTEEMQ